MANVFSGARFRADNYLPNAGEAFKNPDNIRGLRVNNL